jgi:hypothetical protein
MYHDFAGREIEDPEMDAMREDAQEAAREEMATVERLQKALSISARQVHESFLAAEPTAEKWEQVSEEKRARYEKMAARLNGYVLDGIRLDVATQATSGYVWSAEESDQDDYEVHITDAQRRESQAWKAAAHLATEHACNWSVDAQEAGVEDSKDE